MGQYDRKPNKFVYRGMNINVPPDRLSPDYALFLQNVRFNQIGEIKQRPGLLLLGDLDAGVTETVFWGVRMSDPSLFVGFRRFFGTEGGKVYIDDAAHTTFTLKDSGYGPFGFTSVESRPDRSPSPYMFVATRQRMGKFNALGARTNWGLAAPTTAPTTELAQPAYRVIDNCDSTASFTNAGGAGAVSLQTRINTFIAYILYDSGTTGWASVVPAAMAEEWQAGIFITTSANVETVMVQSIYPNIATTTIAAIAYDSGSTGMCTIQLSVPTSGLQRNTVVELGGTERVRVLSVTIGLDGVPSFRCSTVGTFAAGAAVVSYRSFRAYFANNHVADILTASYVRTVLAAASSAATVTKLVTLDLSSTNVGGSRPLIGDDFFHISLNVSDFSVINEIQIQLDCNSTSNNFTQNYFFTSVRQADLANVISGAVAALTAQQQELQRQELDKYRTDQISSYQQQRQVEIQKLLEEKSRLVVELVRDTKSETRKQEILRRLAEIDTLVVGQPFVIDQGIGPVSTQGATGVSQWTEIKIPLSQFQRVGSDDTRSWKDVGAFRIVINSTAGVTIGIDDIWVGGGYGPNSAGAAFGYQYIYVARNTATGSESNPSPPTRYPLPAEREGITGTIAAGYPDSQADVFDIYRLGGTVPEYRYVLTVPTSAPTFTDNLGDDIVLTQKAVRFDKFQPWPRPDRPLSGTGNLTGTRFVRTSGSFLTGTRGTQIIIGNQTFTYYADPETTSSVQLNESGGSGTGVTFQVPEPLIPGISFPVVFGPYSGGSSGDYIFACGDEVNPGYLYYTNGSDPESVSDANILEICPPGERLMNGGILDGIIYLFSDLRSWRILPSFQGGASGAGGLFYAQETSMAKGLVGIFAICFGDRIYWVNFDGIWASRGDAIESLTDDSIAPIFRRDGNPYPGTYTLPKISFADLDESYIQLTYSKEGLYFHYRSVDNIVQTLYYSFLTKGWYYDLYAVGEITFTLREQQSNANTTENADSIVHGGRDGKIYQPLTSLDQDNVQPFTCILRTREEDWGDSRAEKILGDQVIDINPAGQTVTPRLTLNPGGTVVILSDLTGSERAPLVRDVNSGLGAEAVRASLQLTWIPTGGSVVKCYEWQPSALIKPERIVKRVTDWEDGGYVGPKWLQGMRLRADTFNIAKDIRILGDEGATVSDLTITHNGESTKEYSWSPVVAHQMRILGMDSDQWRLLGVEWIFEPEPGLQTRWHIQFTDLDQRGYLHIRDMLIAHRSTANISLVWVVDSTTLPAITISHGSGARVKTYLPMPAIKGKYYSAILTSAASFSLYMVDMEVRVKSWGSPEGYLLKKPFGDISRATGEGGGARI